jgi:hypothetical protein
VYSPSFAYLILSISGAPLLILSTPLPKSHSVLVNLAHPVGVELVASKISPYPDSSGVNFNSSLFHNLSPFTSINNEAIFSLTVISALELNGSTSVYHFAFLCDEATSK